MDRLEFVHGVFKLKQAESFQRRKAKGTLDHKVEGLGTKLQTVSDYGCATAHDTATGHLLCATAHRFG